MGEREWEAGFWMTRLDLNGPWGDLDSGKGPGWSTAPTLFLVSYLLEASPALAEAQTGAGVSLNHHLPNLLGLGRVVESAPHGMAPVSGG